MNILKKSSFLFVITILIFIMFGIFKFDLPTMLCYTIMSLELLIMLFSSLYIMLKKKQKKVEQYQNKIKI